MKVLFIIDQVYLHGGIERVLSIKANYLATSDENEIHIVTTEQKNNKPCYTFNSKISFVDLKINYHRTKSYFHPSNLLKLPKHVIQTIKVLKQIKPDVVVVCSHSVDTYFMPFIIKSIPKVKEFHFSKAIEIIHRNKDSRSKKKYFLKFADFIESKYHKLVVLNKDEAAYYKTNNVVTIPNPLTFYPETVSMLNQPIVIAAGRIAPVKQYDMLIDIWEYVAKKNNTWQLHIYGDGEANYLSMLKSKIKDKNLSKNVFLKGPTNHIKSKMLDSSLFVMTSKNECFPLVLLEAQACGLPIVSFDCPHGPRNIMDNTNGILITPGNMKHFAEAILDIMSNFDKRIDLGKHARFNALNYNVDAIMMLWTKMFNELLKQKN